jgi:hypothetical protein
MMSTILGIAAVPFAFGVALAVLYVRRMTLTRRGAVAMAIRIYRRVPGRGWAPGFATFDQGYLSWYRMFSYMPRPRFVLDRSVLKVEERREPVGAERQIFPPSVVILCCQSPTGEVEIAMTRSALTGFLSWLEAAPPGAASPFWGDR